MLNDKKVPNGVIKRNLEVDSIEKCLWILQKKFHFATTLKLKLSCFQCVKQSLKALLEIKFPVIISLQAKCATYNHVVVIWRKMVIVPPGRLYTQKINGGKCQSGTLNHQNGWNDVLTTYCTGDWLAKFGFVPACIDNCNLSYHGSSQQLCTQGWNDISVRGDCRPCWSYLAADTMVSDFQGAGT